MENFHFVRYNDVISQSSSFPFEFKPIKLGQTSKQHLPVRLPAGSPQSFSYSYQTSGPLIALEKSRNILSRQTTSASTTTARPQPQPRSTLTFLPGIPTTTTTASPSTASLSTQVDPSNVRGLSPRAPKSFSTQSVSVEPFEQNLATVAPSHFDYIPDVKYGNRL